MPPAPEPTPPQTPEEAQQEAEQREIAHQAATEAVEQVTRKNRWEVIANQIPILATMLTVLIALFSSYQTQVQYRDSQASERFQNAVLLLGEDDLTSRIGGITLLGQVAKTSPERRDMAMRLLATYLRVKQPASDATRALPVTDLPAVEEVRAVFAALVYRSDVKDIDMGRINARGLFLSSADLRGLILSRSDLSGGRFSGANFSGVPLMGVYFKSADLSGVNLSQTNAQGANFEGANLKGADLSGADFSGALHLTSAMLEGAKADAQTKLPAGISVPVPAP